MLLRVRIKLPVPESDKSDSKGWYAKLCLKVSRSRLTVLVCDEECLAGSAGVASVGSRQPAWALWRIQLAPRDATYLTLGSSYLEPRKRNSGRNYS